MPLHLENLPKSLANIVIIVLTGAMAMLAQILPSPGFFGVITVLPLLVFFPGYALLSALFPVPQSLRMSIRGVLAVLLSLCIVPAIGTLLDSTPWGIRPTSIILSLLLFSLFMAGSGWCREQRIGHQSQKLVKRPEFTFAELPMIRGGQQWVAGTLFLAVIATGVYWTLLAPSVTQPFTEFYIEPDAAIDASRSGREQTEEPLMLLYTIVNHENQERVYTVTAVMNGVPKQVAGPVRMENGEQWQAIVPVLRDANADQRLELHLFREGDRAPYRTIHLWIGPAQPQMRPDGKELGHKLRQKLLPS
jgi:uncharacterized membrane protein